MWPRQSRCVDTHCACAYANIFQCQAAANVKTKAARKSNRPQAHSRKIREQAKTGQKDIGHRIKQCQSRPVQTV